MRLAARGSRNLDGGEEPLDDPALAARMRRQALRVHVEALLVAGVLTAAAMLVPL